ncbi:YolD-like family protein [Jeotgalibacillus sp. ET6]|uniref:YolD-like family protein n=1 Tax=Jeotgalibacillus TaxID=157226 RepID=UPI0024182F45|nr:YolD-like family protein [Jeotgalibacillus sp. ET6]MDG5470543.1 YolD-like family protein [Jeotgalibacillus sp. ET6]
MNRDRGDLKWQSAMILPEFAQLLSEAKEEYKQVPKPILDEQQVEENEQSILAAMEYNFFSEFKIFHNKAITQIRGYVHFIDYHNRHYRIYDEKHKEHIISFNNLLSVMNLDEIIPL